jgi:hypothetical protein
MLQSSVRGLFVARSEVSWNIKALQNKLEVVAPVYNTN